MSKPALSQQHPRLGQPAPMAWLPTSAVFATILVAGLGTAAAATAQANLSKVEQRLAATIGERQDAAIELLFRAVDINSGSLNLDGVAATGKLFRSEFESLGFTVRWSDMSEVERAGHLIAERKASTADPVKVLLIGHLDTVFEPSSPFQKAEFTGTERSNLGSRQRYAKGPGITDMKGGNVIMLEVLRALETVDALDKLHVIAVLIGDEERSGKPLSIARRDLRQAAQGAHFALGFEDGDGNPATAVVSRRGASGWSLEVTGRPAHSSQIFKPEYGAGAIYEASRILHDFYRELSTIENLTFNPGTIVGGTDVDYDSATASGTAFGKSNVIAERALVQGDLRALSPEQYEDAKKRMRAIVERGLPQTEATIRFTDGYPPMAPTDGNRELLSMLDRASRDLGLGAIEAVNPRNAGAADISFVATLVPSALDGLGLMGTGGHTVNEVADLDTLVTQAQRIAVLLHRITERD